MQNIIARISDWDEHAHAALMAFHSVFAVVILMLCPVIPDGDTAPLLEPVYVAIMWAPAAITIAMCILERHIAWVVRFVTKDDVNIDGNFYRWLIGEPQRDRSRWYPHNPRTEDGKVFRGLWVTLILASFPIMGVMAFPSLIPYAIGIVVLVGAYYTLLRLARWVYEISTKLTNHVNDPNAHKKASNSSN